MLLLLALGFLGTHWARLLDRTIILCVYIATAAQRQSNLPKDTQPGSKLQVCPTPELKLSPLIT